MIKLMFKLRNSEEGVPMEKKKSAPEFEERELEDIGPVDSDRVMVLKKEPLPRKVMLMNAGVKEIRCVCCIQIKPIAEAEDLGDSWVCGECLSEAAEKRRCA
jgi:hypothetical protein